MVSCKSLTSLVTSTQKMFLRTSVFILCFRAKSITQASPLLGSTEHDSKTPSPNTVKYMIASLIIMATGGWSLSGSVCQFS